MLKLVRNLVSLSRYLGSGHLLSDDTGGLSASQGTKIENIRF